MKKHSKYSLLAFFSTCIVLVTCRPTEKLYSCLITKDKCFIASGPDFTPEKADALVENDKGNVYDEDATALVLTIVTFTLNEDCTLPDDMIGVCGNRLILWLDAEKDNFKEASSLTKHRVKRGWLFGRRSRTSATNSQTNTRSRTGGGGDNVVTHNNVNSGSGHIINYHIHLYNGYNQGHNRHSGGGNAKLPGKSKLPDRSAPGDGGGDDDKGGIPRK